jgi:Putative MetA-pathway of phenol degradation
MAGAVLTLLLGGLGTAEAQQLEPRAYSPAPIGMNYVGVGYVYSAGGVVTDDSEVITNLQARVNFAVPFYGRTFGLFGRQASVTVVTPYAWANVHGDLQDVGHSVERSGFADPQVRFAMNILGVPAMTPQEFREYKQGTILGASLTVTAPFSQYDPNKLINIGTNRWAFKPELGLSQPVGDWIFELSAGVWLFGDNNDFYGGNVRSQDPLGCYQAHVVYNFLPGLWASLDYTYYTGGSTTVGGIENNDRQENTRYGVTLAIPLTSSQSLKLNYSRGATVRVGSSFETMGVAWQLRWF